MGFIEDVANLSAVAAAISKVEDILKSINGARSVVLQVDNHTGQLLNRVSDEHSHGGFAVTPSAQIPAQKSDTFGSQSNGNSLFTGTEGSVSYAADGMNLVITWDDPFIGGNGCNASLGGPNFWRYRVVHTCGAGNTEAHMRYELFEAYVAPVPVGTVALYRLDSSATGDRLYTASTTERNAAISQYGYQFAGVACAVFAGPAAGTVPLHRLQKGYHLYTTSDAERDNAVASLGWFPEGEAGYVFNTPGVGRAPLYRLYNPGDGARLFTASIEERNAAVSSYGYTDEGIACYVPV